MLLTSVGLKKPAAFRSVLRRNSYSVRVEAVGAAARSHVDGCAGRPAVLGALVIGHHVELRDGVGRDGDDLVVEALVALAVGVVVHAVEQEVVEHAALAVDVVRALAHQAADRAGRCLLSAPGANR